MCAMSRYTRGDAGSQFAPVNGRPFAPKNRRGGAKRGGSLGRRSSHLKSRPQRTESTAHPTELTVRGIALAQAGRAEEAAKLFGLAAARMPNDPAAHNNFGNALLALGRRADALACFDR